MLYSRHLFLRGVANQTPKYALRTSESVVVARGLGTGGLVIFPRWRCVKGDVVIKSITYRKSRDFSGVCLGE